MSQFDYEGDALALRQSIYVVLYKHRNLSDLYDGMRVKTNGIVDAIEAKYTLVPKEDSEP